ncbi:hypothetical protein [Methylobacterium trifolii]|uniref:Uncharacterized protein n=1 Tax=Methylobacterium trifolii TaxID=1003092 RepID=A0ABQ4U2H3_9HYPH|nr:hypothetical protein [Methylobacterium trifolii]GJE61660.1 hypothetical protein MPOCJGCO_3783 [Methylobacterium trifolii]
MFVTLEAEASAGMYPDDKFGLRTQNRTLPQTQVNCEFATAVARHSEFTEVAGYEVVERLLICWKDSLRAFPSSPKADA